MPTYINLVNWTDQGIRNINEAPQRIDAFKKAIEAAGGKLVGFYVAMGRYDIVTLVDAPNDEAIANIALSTGSKGSVRTETLKAFTEQEISKPSVENATPLKLGASGVHAITPWITFSYLVRSLQITCKCPGSV